MKIKVMIDSNVIIRFLIGDVEAKEVFDSNYQFVTTTRIIDEVIFKLMVINSGKKLKQLKRQKELLEKQIFVIDTVKNFLKDFEFKVYEVKEKHYWKMKSVIKECCLLGNDALTFLIMRENNLKYIATFDSDFDSCGNICNVIKGKN